MAFPCRLARAGQGGEGCSWKNVFCVSFFIFLKKNDLLKREMVSCLGAFFFSADDHEQAQCPEGVSVLAVGCGPAVRRGCVLVKEPLGVLPMGCVCACLH